MSEDLNPKPKPNTLGFRGEGLCRMVEEARAV